MKGPGLRIDHDVRREWRCAKCGKTVRTAVQVVAQRCGCPDAAWMTLQPPVKREPFRPPVREPLPETEAAPERPVPSSGAADISVVEPLTVTVPAAEPAPVEVLVDTSHPATEPAPSTTELQAVPLEPASPEPAASAPAAKEQVPVNPPPDDFGAGLDNPSAEPPA